MTVPVTVLIAAKNERLNLPKCLASVVGRAERVVVLDSHSSDGTAEIARQHGAEVVQFDHRGDYPKKRQWALDTLPTKRDGVRRFWIVCENSGVN
jgi:glycosyltransferase involved in cell wall biosynthesis